MPQSTDRQYQILALQELAEVEETLSKYLRPTHLIRVDLARLLDDLRRKL